MAEDTTTVTAEPADAAVTSQTTEAKPETTTEQVITETKPEVKPDWPTDWRQKLSDGDEKTLKQLERYASPVDIWKKARALETKLSSGQYKTVLPENATEDQVKQWRKENGFPEKADEYDLSGVKMLDKQKEFADWAKQVALDLNIHPSQLKGFLERRAQLLETEQLKADQTRQQIEVKTEDELRAEWGEEYRKNVTLIDSLLDATVGDSDLKTDLKASMKMNPEIGRWLIALSRIHNPTSTVVSGETQNFADAIEDEIASLETLMRNRQSEYWKGPRSEKNQARLRQLYDARARVVKAA